MKTKQFSIALFLFLFSLLAYSQVDFEHTYGFGKHLKDVALVNGRTVLHLETQYDHAVVFLDDSGNIVAQHSLDLGTHQDFKKADLYVHDDFNVSLFGLGGARCDYISFYIEILQLTENNGLISPNTPEPFGYYLGVSGVGTPFNPPHIDSAIDDMGNFFCIVYAGSETKYYVLHMHPTENEIHSFELLENKTPTSIHIPPPNSMEEPTIWISYPDELVVYNYSGEVLSTLEIESTKFLYHINFNQFNIESYVIFTKDSLIQFGTVNYNPLNISIIDTKREVIDFASNQFGYTYLTKDSSSTRRLITFDINNSEREEYIVGAEFTQVDFNQDEILLGGEETIGNHTYSFVKKIARDGQTVEYEPDLEIKIIDVNVIDSIGLAGSNINPYNTEDVYVHFMHFKDIKIRLINHGTDIIQKFKLFNNNVKTTYYCDYNNESFSYDNLNLMPNDSMDVIVSEMLFRREYYDASGLPSMPDSLPTTRTLCFDATEVNGKIEAQPENNSFCLEVELPFAIEYNNPVGLNYLSNNNKNVFNLYPNPVKNQLTIKGDSPIKKIQIIDVSGKLITEQIFNNQTTAHINTTRLTKGMFYMIIDGLWIEKFVKE